MDSISNNQGSIRETRWHFLSAKEALALTKSHEEHGLSDTEALLRLQEQGLNQIKESQSRSLLRMVLDQFKDFMVLILLGSAVISGLLGESEDTLAIVFIVFMNALLGFIQEYRAEKAMSALKALTQTKAKVLRQGQIKIIESEKLVVGDVVLLEAGDLIPADMRLLENQQLRSDESPLTGESIPIEKSLECLDSHEASDLPVGDRSNLLHKGTLVTYGRGKGLVVATGMNTEIGKIATLIQSAGDSQTPLQKRLAFFGKRIALIVIALCLFIFVMGLLRGEDPTLMFMTSLSLAVAAIPEALPAVITVLLALGARRMVSKNALVKRLPAVETLGSVTTICSDKTGTLTQNRMEAKKYFLPAPEASIVTHELRPHRSHPHRSHQEFPLNESIFSRLLFIGFALNNDAFRESSGLCQGDPTEKALLEFAEDHGVIKDEWLKKWPRVRELPFSSERGMMSTLHQVQQNEFYFFTKGAPEAVLARCQDQQSAQSIQPLDAAVLKEIADSMAQEGLRVLALAYKRLAQAPRIDDFTIEKQEQGLTFLGFVGLIDPPRAEVKLAIKECQRASLRVVMITGDHPVTARAIARELEILPQAPEAVAGSSGDSSKVMRRVMTGTMTGVMTGKELAGISDEALATQVKSISVYARVSPEQKIKIVRALQKQGEYVAMTGDGVNDAPALKRADIGVSMGKMGTDVAREASSMVLLDDNFATIVLAIREGRHIFDNIRKFIKYAMATNSGEIWTLFLAPFFGLPVPFLPIHILWINLVTDGLPGLALATEPEEAGLMDRPPRPPNESLFAHGLWQHVLWTGLLMAAVILGLVAVFHHQPQSHWQTMAFTVMTLIQMGHVMGIRSERTSLFKQGLFSNLPLLGAVTLTFILQMATIYIPALNPIFKTEPLTLSELLICLGLAPTLFFAVEIEKLYRRGT